MYSGVAKNWLQKNLQNFASKLGFQLGVMGVLEGIVDYKAKDYTSVNQKTKQIFLYNEAEVHYQDMDIKSGVIIIDYGKDLEIWHRQLSIYN